MPGRQGIEPVEHLNVVSGVCRGRSAAQAAWLALAQPGAAHQAAPPPLAPHCRRGPQGDRAHLVRDVFSAAIANAEAAASCAAQERIVRTWAQYAIANTEAAASRMAQEARERIEEAVAAVVSAVEAARVGVLDFSTCVRWDALVEEAVKEAHAIILHFDVVPWLRQDRRGGGGRGGAHARRRNGVSL
jgi:hypothetical protein